MFFINVLDRMVTFDDGLFFGLMVIFIFLAKFDLIVHIYFCLTVWLFLDLSNIFFIFGLDFFSSCNKNWPVSPYLSLVRAALIADNRQIRRRTINLTRNKFHPTETFFSKIKRKVDSYDFSTRHGNR